MVLESVLGEHMDNIPPVPGTVALTDSLIFWILAVKKDKFITGPCSWMFRGYWHRRVCLPVDNSKQGTCIIIVFGDNVWEKGLPFFSSKLKLWSLSL